MEIYSAVDVFIEVVLPGAPEDKLFVVGLLVEIMFHDGRNARAHDRIHPHVQQLCLKEFR